MCGICGYVSKKKIEDDILVRMRDALIHRGPDDGGIWQKSYQNVNIGLAHRRLSVIDLSELGHQPMHTKDRRYTIVFNGEIYNFKQLREELLSFGYSFKSECDTEVILYSFDKWKEKCFEKFNGMFAIAIWDDQRRRLIVARDRMGVKPLYYYWNQSNGDLVFASELKSIMKYPEFDKNINLEMLGSYLCNKYIQSPFTIFLNTYKLQPGTYAVYENNELIVRKYWDIVERKAYASENLIEDFHIAKKELEKVLTEAVILRLSADVPVGLFLSSGIDSALITAIAQRNSSNPIQTFTIGFDDKARNEADNAKKISKFLNTDHNEYYIGEKELLGLVEDITDYYDEPFGDSSQIPTMLVSKLAKEKVTVALSGDGGDELFCGYKIYDLVQIAQKADLIGAGLKHLGDWNNISGNHARELRAFINNRDERFKTQLFSDVYAEQAKELLPSASFSPKFEFEERLQYKNWQERRMLLDMSTYLPDEVMAKTDRASMKYSLEIRSPLLDVNVVEKSFQIPHNYKYSYKGIANMVMGNKKYILKELAYDYIPKELFSRKKRGFGVPLQKWLRGPLKDEIYRLSNDRYLKNQGIFSYEGVRKLMEKQTKSDNVVYSSMLWNFLIFQKWWQEYIE